MSYAQIHVRGASEKQRSVTFYMQGRRAIQLRTEPRGWFGNFGCSGGDECGACCVMNSRTHHYNKSANKVLLA
uniref:Uncharacterized protein n=1 Tax=Romanomermis culicivorax TaxID=13658 RepID=A0A915JKS5_ROMCU